MINKTGKLEWDKELAEATYLNDLSNFAYPSDDQKGRSLIADFYSKESFIKRLKLHQ